MEQNKTKRKGLLNPDFKYTPSDKTNVQETWRKFGWVPKEKRDE